MRLIKHAFLLKALNVTAEQVFNAVKKGDTKFVAFFVAQMNIIIQNLSDLQISEYFFPTLLEIY